MYLRVLTVLDSRNKSVPFVIFIFWWSEIFNHLVGGIKMCSKISICGKLKFSMDCHMLLSRLVKCSCHRNRFCLRAVNHMRTFLEKVLLQLSPTQFAVGDLS